MYKIISGFFRKTIVWVLIIFPLVSSAQKVYKEKHILLFAAPSFPVGNSTNVYQNGFKVGFFHTSPIKNGTFFNAELSLIGLKSKFSSRLIGLPSIKAGILQKPSERFSTSIMAGLVSGLTVPAVNINVFFAPVKKILNLGITGQYDLLFDGGEFDNIISIGVGYRIKLY